MKKLLTFLAVLCMAVPAIAAPPKKDEKKKEKEVPDLTYTVIVGGAKDETAGEQVKAFLSAMKDVKVEECTKTGETVEATISTKMRISRSDVSKALKDKKELVVKEFKVKRPDKKTDAKKEEPKKDEPKKEEPSKVEPKKDAPAAAEKKGA